MTGGLGGHYTVTEVEVAFTVNGKMRAEVAPRNFIRQTKNKSKGVGAKNIYP